MTPGEFIAKWSDTGLRERAGSQSHFIDLRRLLGEQAPTDADPKGEWYAFEKGTTKTGGGDGWADVSKRGCFACPDKIMLIVNPVIVEPLTREWEGRRAAIAVGSPLH
jgi:hypothetical protein